jgi:hypothetical protein
MALKGDLADVGLLSVLRMLSDDGASGRLSLTRESDSGDVFMASGNMVHVSCGSETGREALFRLVTWSSGSFEFHPDVAPPERTISDDAQQIILEASTKVQEWGQIKEIVPSNDAVFRISPKAGSEAVTLDPGQWAVLAQVDGRRSVADIAKSSGQGEFEVARTIYSLHLAGAVDITSEAASSPVVEIVDPKFFDTLSAEFCKTVGPLGPVILDENIEALGHTREGFPRERLADLVERLSREISTEEKSTEFQRVMLDALRSLE